MQRMLSEEEAERGRIAVSARKALEDLGFTEIESTVYRSMLSLGARPAGIIAQRIGLKRGQTYAVLDKLAAKGIVQEFIKNNVKYFTCIPPSGLRTIISQRQAELSKQSEQLEAIIPHLLLLRGSHSVNPAVRLLPGAEGVKQIYEDMLTVPRAQIRSVRDSLHCRGSAEKLLGARCFDYIRRRTEMEISCLTIIIKDSFGGDGASQLSTGTVCEQLEEIRYVNGLKFPVELSIYGDRVAFVSLHSSFSGVLIECPHIAAGLKNIHEAVWQALSR